MSLAVGATVALPGAAAVAPSSYDPPPVGYDNGNPAVTRQVEIVDVSSGQPDYRRLLTSCQARTSPASCTLKMDLTTMDTIEWRGGVSTADVEASLGRSISRGTTTGATCSQPLKPGETYYIYPTFTFYIYRVHSTAPPFVDYVNGNGWAPVDMLSDTYYKQVYDGGVVCSTIKAEG